MKRLFSIIGILSIFCLLLLAGCNRHTCPANNGGYVEKVKYHKHSKPQSGLWSKKMRRKE